MLPLYFQTVLGVDPTVSGIQMLPLIIAMSVFSIVSAIIITKGIMPIYVMLSGAAIATIASGLVHSFDLNTRSATSLGYMALLGVGYGFCLQLGIIVAQESSRAEDMAETSAVINCSSCYYISVNILVAKTYGAAIFSAVGQSIFSNQLIRHVSENITDIDPKSVISSGATTLSNEFTPNQVVKLLQLFTTAFQDTFILPIALNGLSFCFPFLLNNGLRFRGSNAKSKAKGSSEIETEQTELK